MRHIIGVIYREESQLKRLAQVLGAAIHFQLREIECEGGLILKGFNNIEQLRGFELSGLLILSYHNSELIVYANGRVRVSL